MKFLLDTDTCIFVLRHHPQEHARLRMSLKKMPIGERDLVIASVALAHRLTVVTHNQREFGRIPGLKTIDWAGQP